MSARVELMERTRLAIASMVADRARLREAGPGADDNGATFRALRDLARDLGYEGEILPSNSRRRRNAGGQS